MVSEEQVTLGTASSTRPETIVSVNSAERSTLLENIGELWQARPLIRELVKREFRNRYKNSVGGVAWSMIPPLVQIAVITFLVKYIWNSPIHNYSAYIFGVMFLWTFFQTAIIDGTASLAANAEILRKVYLPRAIFPMMSLLNSMVHYGIGFVLTVLFFLVVGTYPQHLQIKFLMIVPVVFFLSVFALGLILILSYAAVFYEDIRFIVTSILSLMIYALPIFYPIEAVYKPAHPHIYQLYMLNPLAAFTVTYQRALMHAPPDSTLPGIPWMYFFIACCVSVLTLIVGFTLFEKHQWEVVERL